MLTHWNNSLHVYIFLCPDTWSWANQSLLVYLDDVCLAEQQQMSFDSLWFEPTGPWTRTHNIIISIWACLPLHHQSLNVISVSSKLMKTWRKTKITILIVHVHIQVFYLLHIYSTNLGLPWSWSYDSWIYNYLCNQCLSPLTLWVRTPFMARSTRYNIMW